MPDRARKTANDLRCFCARAPLLAVYGIDKDGKLYVHVRVYKQNRIYGEVLVTGGTVKLHCRECLRWHRVVIRQRNKAELKEDTDSSAAALNVLPAPCLTVPPTTT